jgi:hypothetical protein
MDVTTTAVTDIADVSVVSGGTVGGATLDYVPLTDHLMRNKFQLFNRNRQKLVGDVRRIPPLRITQPFVDSKTGLTFMLMSYTFKPISDTYTVNLYEYDNTVDITLTIIETTTTG